jgi:hypothetical protein
VFEQDLPEIRGEPLDSIDIEARNATGRLPRIGIVTKTEKVTPGVVF